MSTPICFPATEPPTPVIFVISNSELNIVKPNLGEIDHVDYCELLYRKSPSTDWLVYESLVTGAGSITVTLPECGEYEFAWKAFPIEIDAP